MRTIQNKKYINGRLTRYKNMGFHNISANGPSKEMKENARDAPQIAMISLPAESAFSKKEPNSFFER
jgi:hypothetical protein